MRRHWQPWLILLCAVVALALAPVAAAQTTSGLKIELDQQTAGSRTLSGKITNVPQDVQSVAVTVKVTANLQKVQIVNRSNDFKFSFSDVASWTELRAVPVSSGRMGSAGPGDPNMGLPPGGGYLYNAQNAMGSGYGSGSGTGYGYGYGAGYGCGTGLAYTYITPGYYGYPSGAQFISGYYLAPYYRFYQPTPNWMYQPYAYYGYSPYSYFYGGWGC